MTTIYTFTLDNGAQMSGGPTSTILLADGTRVAPSAVVEGDRVSHAAGWFAVVVSISTQEV
jgi:hypothetical protein